MQSDLFALSRPEDLQVRVQPIETTRYPILIVDNVYRHPQAVRDFALSLPYTPLGAGGPGARADLPDTSTIGPLRRLVQQHVGDAYGWPLSTSDAPDPTGTRFHRMRSNADEGPPAVSMPHIDRVMLAGVVYLNLPQQCRGGTKFFRHRATGICEWRVRTAEAVAPSAVSAVMELGFDNDYRQGVLDGRWQDYDELRSMIFHGPEGPPDFMAEGSEDWIQIDAVDMRWNRLICFPGFVFHTSHYDPRWFGSAPGDGRLIQNLLCYWPMAEPPA
ncbi:MAG: hypothetical protein K0V04_37610 [Deltaproteobacteria bacterium]|nr:hypothetical protein [Deltaproteobacteria bacterium]